MNTEHLREIGLTDNEIRIYLELLKQGEALASELANRTKVNRTLTYQILNKLLERGLISYVIKNNTKYFKSAHPSKLIDFLKDKELNIQELIPELSKLTKSKEKKYDVELYEGLEGLKTILNDVIRTKPKEFLDLTSGMTTIISPPYYMDNWEKRRIKAKIYGRFLFNYTEIGRKRGKQLAKLKLSKVKYLPKGLMSPSHIYIYENKVGITLWEKESLFGILIKSQEIANRFREFFNWFWKISK